MTEEGKARPKLAFPGSQNKLEEFAEKRQKDLGEIIIERKF